MAQRKKKSSSAKSKKQASVRNEGHPVLSIVLFFVTLLLFIVAVIPGENFWNAIHNFLLGVGGFWIFPWLALAGYILGASAFGKLLGQGGRMCGIASLLFSLGTFTQLIVAFNDGTLTYGGFIQSAYTTGIGGGGVVGALLSYPLGSLFGKIGTIIILSLVLCVIILLLTRTTLQQFLGAMSKPVQKITANTKEAIEHHRRNREEKEWDISLDGMPDEPIDPIHKDTADIETKGKRLVSKYRDEPIEEVQGEMVPQEEIDEINREAGSFAAEPEEVIVPVPVPEQEQADLNPVADEPTMVLQEEHDGQQTFSGIQIDVEQKAEYRYPPINLLEQNVSVSGGSMEDELKNNAVLLVDTLRSFGVETRILNISRGPSVTRYELQPAAGVKIAKIKNLADDIALNLATDGVRIEAPIPNKAAVGIEVPNKTVASVRLRDIIDSSVFDSAKSKLTGAVGKDITGNIITTDISKMPHLLIAGTTGSGKSVCINSILLSVLYKATPDEVKLLLIDPKVVEFEVYNGLPHLLVPVVSDAKRASGALGWAVQEMERRYKLFGECRVRDLNSYNQFAEKNDGFEKMPQILIVVDELADLMMVAPAEVEDSICRLAQKARAAGMHLVVATQRPSADVITGLIKANIPSRISLRVANAMESRIILDTQGAEKLLGRGDMLFYPVGMPKPTRVQGCWVSDDEIKNVVSYIVGDRSSEYNQDISDAIERIAVESKNKKNNAQTDESDSDDGDELLPQATEYIIDTGSVSTSMLQRRFKIGYNRAARIVDELEAKGFVGPFEGSKPRKVLITRSQYEEMRMGQSD